MGVLDCVTGMPSGLQNTQSREGITMGSEVTLDNEGRDVESQAKENKTHSIWWKVLVDLPLFILFVIIIGLLESGIIAGHKSGFYCNDPALSFKMQSQTVPAEILINTILLAPIVFFYITECIFINTENSNKSRFLLAIKSTGYLYRNYMFGLILNFSFVEILKRVAGAPRPHFFDSCQPDSAKNCTGSEYISTFECTSQYSWIVQSDSYHSFPSGHTSLSVYFALFTAWYLQRRTFNWRSRSLLLVPFIQLILISFAALSSISRITDKWHHWWDVLTGAFVAFLCLGYAICLNGNFKTFNKKKEKVTRTNSNDVYY